jgi:hypothetical protein
MALPRRTPYIDTGKIGIRSALTGALDQERQEFRYEAGSDAIQFVRHGCD